MTEFLDARDFGDRLKSDLKSCSYFHAAVSYVKVSGIDPLLTLREEQLKHSQLITCTDFGITEPEALEKLVRYGHKISCFRDSGLHSKVWIIYNEEEEAVVYVGSSNLSRSAASSNVEANVRSSEKGVVDSTVKWFSTISESKLASLIDLEWIESYRKDLTPPVVRSKPLPQFPELRKDVNIPSGVWHEKNGAKTFLAQGILEGVTQAASSRSSLLARTSIDNRARIVLLNYDGEGRPQIFADVPATLNRTGESTVQLGGGRRTVHQWLQSVWGFDWEKSVKMNHLGRWKEWFEATEWTYADFAYDIMVDLKDLLPTVWARPHGRLVPSPNLISRS